MEVTLAQLDSFTRSVDHTQEYMTSSSYVAMAAQGIYQVNGMAES